MSGERQKREVAHYLCFEDQAQGSPKMAAALHPGRVSNETDCIANLLPAPQDAYGHPSTPVSALILPAASPASTESLLGRSFYEPLSSPINSPADLNAWHQAAPFTSGQTPDMVQILTRFSEMLANGLVHTAAQITNSIKMDLQSLGTRIEAIEQTVDQTVLRANQNTNCIQTLQDQLDTAQSKIDDRK